MNLHLEYNRTLSKSKMKSQALLDPFFILNFVLVRVLPKLEWRSTVKVSLTDDGLALVLIHGPGPQ